MQRFTDVCMKQIPFFLLSLFIISHAFRLYVFTAIEEDFASKSTWHRNVIELKAEQFHKKQCKANDKIFYDDQLIRTRTL